MPTTFPTMFPSPCTQCQFSEGDRSCEIAKMIAGQMKYFNPEPGTMRLTKEAAEFMYANFLRTYQQHLKGEQSGCENLDDFKQALERFREAIDNQP